MECACCGQPIDPRQSWKGSEDRFYCSGFCADSETDDPTATTRHPGYFGALKSAAQRALSRHA
jgi:hypothetical protein